MTTIRTMQFLRGRDTPVTADFAIGQRVRMHPATDAFMRGIRWGTVASVGHALIRVHCDIDGRTRAFHPVNLQPE